jgi:hypothetical protein
MEAEREASHPPVPETGSSEEAAGERDERMRGAVSRRDADAAKILKSLPVAATSLVSCTWALTFENFYRRSARAVTDTRWTR